MADLPVFLRLEGRSIALVGSGAAAVAKLRLLRTAGARVRWFVGSGETSAPAAVAAALRSSPGPGMVEIERGDPLQMDVRAFAAVVSAAGRPLDDAVAAKAQAAGIPVNVVDRLGLCSFIFPAIVSRGDVTVAIGTGGASPVLARRIRERIEAVLPGRIGDLAALLGRYRKAFAAVRHSSQSLRRFWEGVIDGPVGALALSGRMQEAEAALVQAVNRTDRPDTTPGAVFLVGAGPGDPDLLTLRALHVLQAADIVFHDDLVSPEILDRCRRDAERVFVGKRRGQPGMAQEEINARLVAAARRGQVAVRLKSGDPFVFGRGGEEMESLRAAGVSVIVVPGVTAALGCAAEAGLPLTYRGEAGRVCILTAHRAEEADSANWAGLGDAQTTVVVYMGLACAAAVRDGLLRAGRAPHTPVAVIARGTQPRSQIVTGRLDRLSDLAAEITEGPALLVISDTVTHSPAWLRDMAGALAGRIAQEAAA